MAVQLMLVNGMVWDPLRIGIDESTVSTATRELFGVARLATLILISGLPLIATPLPSSPDFILKETSSILAPPAPIDSINPGVGGLLILNFAACTGCASQLKAAASNRLITVAGGMVVIGLSCGLIEPLDTTAVIP